MPFIAINIISVLFVYRNSSYDLSMRLIFGIDDGVMWYVPWIFTFYVIFYMLCKVFNGDLKGVVLGMFITGIAQAVLFGYLGFGSQWYTSNAALIAGVLIAQYENKIELNRWHGYVFFAGMLFTIAASRADIPILRECLITLSGVFFALVIYVIGLKLADAKFLKIQLVSYLGTLSYWIYMTHMKVAFVLNEIGILNLFTLLIGSFLISIALYAVWRNTETALLHRCGTDSR